MVLTLFELGLMADLPLVGFVDYRATEPIIERRRRSRRHGIMPLFDEVESASPRHMIPSPGEALREAEFAPVLEQICDLDMNHVKPIENADPSLFSVAGLDLRVGEVYRADCVMTINGKEHLEQLVAKGRLQPIQANGGAVTLEADSQGRVIYYLVSTEVFHLPPEYGLLVDAKSTTGRLGCMCTDKASHHFQKGFQGPVIVSAQPFVFPIEVTLGRSALVQAVIRYRNTRFMTREEIAADNANISFFRDGKKIDLVREGLINEQGVRLGFDTASVLRAKSLSQIPRAINVDTRGEYNPGDYFDLVQGDGEVKMEAGRFYLFGTQESIALGNVCGILRRETLQTTGLWWHFAGIVWPGYSGPITQECMSQTDRIITRGNLAGYLEFDKLEGEIPSGKSYSGSYQNQRAPMPPKMFKPLNA